MSQTMEQQGEGSSMHEDEDKKKQKSRRPANTAFRQQRLKAWQPILTPKTVLPLFFAVGIIFAPIGGLLLWASSQVKELNIDYSECQQRAPDCTDGVPPDDSRIPNSLVSTYFSNSIEDSEAATWCKENVSVSYGVNIDYSVETEVCRIQFYIPDDMTPPVLLYYQLTNFYQNHRRYVSSFDQQQLEGNARDNSSIESSDCEPLDVNDDGKAYYPCGLIANSMFNDTYNRITALNQAGSSEQNTTYEMTNRTVAWESDSDLYGVTEYEYGDVVPPPFWQKRYPEYNESFPFPNLKEDEPFQVWMRTAGLPTFSKLALRNDDDTMERGRYQIDIYDNFPVTIYDGTKSILLSTRTVMGGRNPYMGIAYVVVGGVCIILGAIFTATHLIKPRKLGDHTYLSWNTDQPSSATATGRAARPGDTA